MYKLSCIACVYSPDGLTKMIEEIGRQTLNLDNGLQLIVATTSSDVRDAAEQMDGVKVFYKAKASASALINNAKKLAEAPMDVLIDESFSNEDSELFDSVISQCDLLDSTTARFLHKLVPAVTAKLEAGANLCYEEIAIRIVNHLLSRKITKTAAEDFTPEEHEQYVADLYALIDQISWDAIFKSSVLILPKRMYMASIKNRNASSEFSIDGKKRLCVNDIPLYGLAKTKPAKIEIIDIADGNITLEGFEYLSSVPGMRFVAETDNGASYEAKTEPWIHRNLIGIDGTEYFEGSKFAFAIPVNESGFRFYGILGDVRVPINYNFGVYTHLDPANENAYYARETAILKYRDRHFTISRNTSIGRFFAERAYNKSLAAKGRNDIVAMRKEYAKRKKSMGKLWVVRDNEERARDSGLEVFKFLSKHKDEYPELADVTVRFILSPECEDYEIASQYGEIISPYTDEYKMTMLMADVVIDTRGGISCKYVFGDDGDAFSNLCTWDYIWLPHGVYNRNHSTWTHKFVFNAKLYASSSKREYDSIADKASGYGYDNEVALTGLPRQDGYDDIPPEKMIVFLPTWRRHLAGDLIPGTSERTYSDKLKGSDFCVFFNSLINDERLLSVMKEYGYTGEFYLHPSFIKQIDDMEGNDIITVGRKIANTNKLVSRAACVITDYSSVEFDAAYLRKPVVYTQYDADTFFNLHTGSEGYFDQTKDGFGPVCYNLDESVDAIINQIKNGCVLEGKYLENANKFFEYNDRNNSRRIVERVIDIENR